MESRSWVRWLGVAALGAVIAQGILGGITVMFFLPPPVSAAHATLAQIFFCTVVSIALFTSAWWERERPHGCRTPAASAFIAGHRHGLRLLCLQLMLGAAFRHKAFGIIPHLVGAVVVTGLIFWLGGRAAPPLSRMCRSCAIRARVLHALIGLQLLLGAAAWWSRIYAAQFPAADSGHGHASP